MANLKTTFLFLLKYFRATSRVQICFIFFLTIPYFLNFEPAYKLFVNLNVFCLSVFIAYSQISKDSRLSDGFFYSFYSVSETYLNLCKAMILYVIVTLHLFLLTEICFDINPGKFVLLDLSYLTALTIRVTFNKLAGIIMLLCIAFPVICFQSFDDGTFFLLLVMPGIVFLNILLIIRKLKKQIRNKN